MRSLNKVLLIGNLGKDPEYIENQNFKRVSFPLATNEIYLDKNNNQSEITEWHNVVMWGKLAELARTYLKKGNQIFVEGKIRSRSYEEHGIKKYITEIRCDNFILLGPKRDASPTEISNDVVRIQDEQVISNDFSFSSYGNDNDNDIDNIKSTDDIPF